MPRKALNHAIRAQHPQKWTRIPPADKPIESYPHRAAYLHGYQTKLLPTDLMPTLLPVCADLVSRVPAPNRTADVHLMAAVLRLALWCARTIGRFDPARDLTDDNFEACLRDADLTDETEKAYRSALRMVRDGKTIRKPTDYNPAKPYTPHEWQAFEDAADDLIGTRWAALAWMMLILTGHLGLRAREAVHLRGTALTRTRGGLLLDVVGSAFDDVKERTLPVVGAAADHLTPHLGLPTYLLFDKFAVRGNTINHLSLHALPRHHHAFAGFDANRARATWLARLITTMTMQDVMYLAGLGPRTYTAQDIAAALPTPEPNAIRGRYLTQAFPAAAPRVGTARNP